MAEFKIGRLRYTWRGQWATATFYNRDAVIQYNGKTFVCLEPHTSTDFYSALYASDPIQGPTPYWSLMLDGRVWQGDWQTDELYSLGNIVKFGGIVYVCTVAHTSAGNAIDLTKFTTFSKFDNWNIQWNPNYAYGVGDLVRYGGIVYRCIVNHVSSATTVLGLEVDQAKWEIVNDGIDYRGDYITARRYRKNDIVKNGPGLYICTVGHTSSGNIDPTKFIEWLPGFEFGTTWSGTTVYQPGDAIIYGGYSYVSKTVNNINQIPSTESDDWALLTTGYKLQGDWNTGSAYRVGDIVRRSGRVYEAVSDNQGQDPTAFIVQKVYTATGSSGKTFKVNNTTGIVVGMMVNHPAFSRFQSVVTVTNGTTIVLDAGPDGTIADEDTVDFVGVNYAYWKIVTPGATWRKFWTNTTQYIIGDLVIWANATYRCVRNHTSASMLRPDLDTDHVYWIDFLLHARQNAGNTIGDITSHDGEKTIAFPVGEQDFILRSTDGHISWKNINVVPAVFYVSPTGTDQVGYGFSIDKPWRSIAYACQQVKNGPNFPNARALIDLNEEFIAADVLQYLLFENDNDPTLFDNAKTLRDTKLVLDAIIYDISRGGNSQTVAATLAYFAPEFPNTFINATTAARIPYFIAGLQRAQLLLGSVLINTAPQIDFQEQNEVDPEDYVDQVVDPSKVLEPGASAKINDLFDILLTALQTQSTEEIPAPNQGLTATIMIKTGTYKETLPIIVPANVALNGDELRGAVVMPKVSIYSLITAATANSNKFTVLTTEGMIDGTPVMFAGTTAIGGVQLGQKYYVIGSSVTATQFSIRSTPTGPGNEVFLSQGTGEMTIYGGDAIKDMFYVRNGSGIRNMTLSGLAGTLGPINQYLTRRPTGGAYVSLDPGEGPDDTEAWISRKSPYIQNVSTFGVGCVGLKIDGDLHNGGNKSIVCNDYTQILSDGIGIWVKGPGAVCEAVSVFSYFGYAGYFAEDGGKLRATNGNTSYGTYGVVAEGYDLSEDPITGKVFNRSTEAAATVQSSFGSEAQLLALSYTNAGQEYFTTTTNIIKYSNNLLNGVWTADSLNITQNSLGPTGLSDAWTLSGTTSGTDNSYIHQTVAIQQTGQSFTAVPTTNITGSGGQGDLSGPASFDVVVGALAYVVSVNYSSSGYVVGNQLRISGSQVGGIDGINDITITVQSLAGSSVLTITATGTVPAGSVTDYTLSVHVKQRTSPTVDLWALFTGFSTKGSSLTFNFADQTLTPASQEGSGYLPINYGKQVLSDGWYRLYFTVRDLTGLNSSLQFRLYPRGKTGSTADTLVYGFQTEIATQISFYLKTDATVYTSYADFAVVGAGTGAVLVGEETRSRAVTQARITDNGNGYLTASNNSQGGTKQYVILAGSNINTESQLIGMRCFINSGTGAGQYGYVSSYESTFKYLYVLKESFTPLPIGSSAADTDTFSTPNTSSLYVDMPVQFIPTYYTTTVTATSIDNLPVISTIGGVENIITVASTEKLRVNMPVIFTGITFGNIAVDFTYYVIEIVSATTFRISNEQFGNEWLLVSASGSEMDVNFPSNTNYITAGSTDNMLLHMPVNFTGESTGGITTAVRYYIKDIIDATTFTIADTLLTTTVTATNATGNVITVGSTADVNVLDPIVLDAAFGGLTKDTKYYVSKILGGTTLTVASQVINAVASETQTTTNLIFVDSTAGFVANNPIRFIGNQFGNLVPGNIYYILAVNDGVSFTVSGTPGGGAVNQINAVGYMTAQTAPAPATVTTETGGTVTATFTNAIETLTADYGAMNASFSTSLFGGISKGVTYYVRTITASSFTITTLPGGNSNIAITTATGSMNVAEVGWDHINPGSEIETALDSSTVYFIEPRTQFPAPVFSQTSATLPTLATGTTYVDIMHGPGQFIAIPSGNSTFAKSTDGATWTALSIPTQAEWTAGAYGNSYYVVISQNGGMTESNSKVIYSASNGTTWKVGILPSKTTWNRIAYGDGKFVAIATGTASSAYSNTYGATWFSGSGLPNAAWSGLAYGAGKFVAVAGSGTTAAYSINGTSWTASTLPSNTNWSDVAFGNGVFVAVSSDGAKTAVSSDGITWRQSDLPITASKIVYGQGVFLATPASGTTAYTSEDGIKWKTRSVIADAYGATAFGFMGANYIGTFVSAAGQATGSTIFAGTTTKGRLTVVSGEVISMAIWEPGSNYVTTPDLTITDPNASSLAGVLVRSANGVLANPTFVNRGTGYNTNSTTITVNGNGFADAYQTGFKLVCTELTRLPRPGDNLIIGSETISYKITNATAMFGTVAPNIMATLDVAPDISRARSPDHLDDVTIRTQYSQVRLTGHDFLNIGYGNKDQSNYPGFPQDTELAPQDQVIESNNGRVFYTSTDQDGNFRVGGLFNVEQATGIITISATQFGLEGLDQLSLGGIAVGGAGVVIRQFSTDSTFVANSNNTIPTQRAIKAYLTGRLSQGGSNTFTGQTTAGVIRIGGPDKIESTIPDGQTGSSIKMINKVVVAGDSAAWAGDGLALQYFIKTWWRR